jgi:hypothetical protein
LICFSAVSTAQRTLLIGFSAVRTAQRTVFICLDCQIFFGSSYRTENAFDVFFGSFYRTENTVDKFFGSSYRTENTLLSFPLQPTKCTNIYDNILSLYNVHTYIRSDTSVSSTGSFENLYFLKLHKFLSSQDIETSHRLHCIIQPPPNNILMYLKLIMLGDSNYESYNFKNLRNLAKYKIWNSLRMTQMCRNM